MRRIVRAIAVLPRCTTFRIYSVVKMWKVSQTGRARNAELPVEFPCPNASTTSWRKVTRDKEPTRQLIGTLWLPLSTACQFEAARFPVLCFLSASGAQGFRVSPPWQIQPASPYLGDFFSAFLGFMLICRSAAASD